MTFSNSWSKSASYCGVEGEVGFGESKMRHPFPEGLHDLSMVGGGGSSGATGR